jgi:branched-chain amino acid transport system ATP-binding protein
VVAIEDGAVVDDLETRGGEHVKARLLERLAL